MDERVVSVIVPLYNSERYIRRCIESVINQTFLSWELLLIDDESTDQSGDICRAYANSDSRIRYHKKKHGGPADTRNVGIGLARGKYLAFIDSDDYCERNFLEAVMGEMLKTDADMCIFGYYLHRKHTKKAFFYGNGKIEKEKAIESLLLDHKIENYLCNKVYKRSLFDSICLPQGEIFEDVSVMYKLILQSNYIIGIDKVLYHYQKRRWSLSYCPRVAECLFYWGVLVERKAVIDRCYPEKEKETKFSLTKGAIFIWNQISKQCNRSQLYEYRFLIDYIQKNIELVAAMPLRTRIMAHFICRMPFQYSAMVYFMKGKRNA